jgi:hypothetical protein
MRTRKKSSPPSTTVTVRLPHAVSNWLRAKAAEDPYKRATPSGVAASMLIGAHAQSVHLVGAPKGNKNVPK